MNAKDVAEKVREYVKRNCPALKFSVTVDSSATTGRLNISLMQGPRAVYKEFAELTEAERKEIRSKYMRYNNIGSAWPDELDAEISAGAFLEDERPQYMNVLLGNEFTPTKRSRSLRNPYH